MNTRKLIVRILIVSGILLLAFLFLPVKTVIADRDSQEPGASCLAAAAAQNDDYCRQMEAAILQTTVRYQFDYWFVKQDESGYLYETAIGHGTVKDGRYLVTHNHFSQPFANQPEVDLETVFQQIKIYNADGDLLTQLPGETASIIVQERETLVLDFGEVKGHGFFTNLGFVSAHFRAAHLNPPPIGAEVAQIDWDGTIARVDWAAVEELKDDSGVLTLVMSDNLKIGASGGGVFIQGAHIGNNWQTAPLGHISTAALNSSWAN